VRQVICQHLMLVGSTDGSELAETLTNGSGSQINDFVGGLQVGGDRR